MNTPPLNETPSLQEQAEAYLAWREGREVEYWVKICKAWWNLGDAHTIGNDTILRLKPAPKQKKYRAWKPEEVPVGALVRVPNTNGLVTTILAASTVGVSYCAESGYVLEHELSRFIGAEYSLDHGKTWLPCGVETTE